MEFDSSKQTTTWFRDRYREGSLIIKPPYQRNPVWVARQKCYLIESILLGLPIPEIYVQRSTSEEGENTFGLVDGQQRIRAVLQFIGSETEESELDYNRFTLDYLPPQSPWYNKSFADLSADDKKKFYGYNFVVRFLDTDDESALRDMFTRLNQYQERLTAQEIRNARFTGPFARLAIDLANDTYWAENGILTASSIRRMGDIEYMAELLIGIMHGPQGGASSVIDQYYLQYEDYEDEFPEQNSTQQQFGETLRAVQNILPDIRSTRWKNKGDFYSLFVALAVLLRRRLSEAEAGRIRDALDSFEASINRRRLDETADVSADVMSYLEALQRGANDKGRRADRHEALLHVLDPVMP